MQQPKHFKFKEMINSNTALAKGILNAPDWDQIVNLHNLALNYLDPIREAWGKSITVSSGFRSAELNKAVKGSTTSSHLEGLAADLQPVNPTKANVEKLFNFVVDFLKEHNMEWDQCYIENCAGKTWWVHFGIGPKMRKEVGTWTK